ncbi:DUF2569 family protein [Halomonas binhaiensis]|uniref:DUF2569 family protein n=1 Tax=Halomonas binhaiensis TaxID=2562282 RepID=A0A856QPT7_9GAMM|nr:DUF2569 family protein [Halomonas binhaiensis]QEM81922.2 DUF2569 family protein [Halomonas binhaiensis]
MLTLSHSSMPYPTAPKGVGGWLRFFIVVVCIIGLARVFAAVYELENTPGVPDLAGWETYRLAMYVGGIGSVVMMFWLAYILSKGEQMSLRNDAIKILWIAGPVLLIAAGAVMQRSIPDAQVFNYLIPGLLATTFWTTVWTIYFLKSKRVANTYWKKH